MSLGWLVLTRSATTMIAAMHRLQWLLAHPSPSSTRMYKLSSVDIIHKVQASSSPRASQNTAIVIDHKPERTKRRQTQTLFRLLLEPSSTIGSHRTFRSMSTVIPIRRQYSQIVRLRKKSRRSIPHGAIPKSDAGSDHAESSTRRP